MTTSRVEISNRTFVHSQWGSHFFSSAIPIYGVLPYSMMNAFDITVKMPLVAIMYKFLLVTNKPSCEYKNDILYSVLLRVSGIDLSFRCAQSGVQYCSIKG